MDPTKISQQQLDKIAEKIFEANYFHGSVERAISRNINKQNVIIKRRNPDGSEERVYPITEYNTTKSQ